jgi:hypothetical protein
VGFAAAGLSEEQDGTVLVDEAQGGEIFNELAVHAGF